MEKAMNTDANKINNKVKDLAINLSECKAADCAYCRRDAAELLKILPEFIAQGVKQ